MTPDARPMAQTLSSRVADYGALAAVLLGVALIAKQPQLIGLAAPFAVALVFGLVLTRRPSLTIETSLSAHRIVEGEPLELTVTVCSDVSLDRFQLAVPLPPGLRYGDDVAIPTAFSLAAGRPHELILPLQTEQWGVFRCGEVSARARGPLGLAAYEAQRGADETVRVFPAEETLRALIEPDDTTLAVGSRRARLKGEGFEFADLRPFVPGDRMRNVNWRATARLGSLRVNDHHPERSGDVVLLVDAFEHATLPAAVRAAVALARAYLTERDRVGVISFGGVLRWLRLGQGARQHYRIVEALIESSANYSYAWKGLDLVPPQALPAHALLVAVTPLSDRRTITALVDRAARRTSVAVVHISLEAFASPGRRPVDRLGYVLWQHETDRLLEALRERGITVATWVPGEPLAATIEEVTAFQRYARHRVG